MDPINYTSTFADLPSPQAAMMQGLQNGAGILQLQQQQQQQADALAQQQQQRQVIQALIANPNPTAQDFARASLAVPGMREQFKQSWDMHSSEQQRSALDEIGQVHAAMMSGQPKYAVDILNKRATALENSGGPPEQIKAARDMAQTIEVDPNFARALTGMKLMSIPGGDKVIASIATMGKEQRDQEQAPGALKKVNADADAAVSDAETKAITAKYADSKALADLDKSKWDVRKIVADIDFQKESNRIAAMKAAIEREANGLKRQELQLKISDAVTARDDKVRAKVAEAESAAGSIDNMLNNITRILDVARDKDGKPTSVLRASAGPLDSRLPTVQGDVADMEALVESLGAQAFLAQIPNIKGMGSLSNAEGEKLQSAFQNFSLKQSPEQIIYNLMDAKRLLEKGRGTVSKRFGVPLGNPDTPAAAGGRPPLSSFEKG